MNTKIINGKLIKQEKFEEFKLRIKNLKDKNIVPHLAVVQVGDNESSNIYIKHKKIAAKKLGIKFSLIKLNNNIDISQLKTEILKLNKNINVNGILVQLPLPKSLNDYDISNLIVPYKDVDGIHPYNQGVNFTNQIENVPKPCTAIGIMEIFKYYNIQLEGKHALIIGRSNIVGRPISYLLTHANATTSIVHSKTNKKDLEFLSKNADIIILATGQPDIISPNMVKEGVVIIDVGISRQEDKSIRGDVMHEDFLGIASFISPVPGGVGPLTIMMLMQNIIEMTEMQVQM